ncbi:sulfatase-like hydrolase/transferase [Cohnella zeiphila]|uniref:Sulfatase-like hydrolase/transferase n=1 Tax=Cohnella zeiphila TaxID=2761120 RepID=A0A7X0VX41_9BACL|nr:sulfatase-like hydrolase/transferase [Cohnella zeiphila]MBB6733626.1 sulfatase-like hydrolase/transferase [Cohnella zeiphila]
MAKRASQPNVIVFFTDQQRWDTTGAHGNPLGLTPNFDRMAAGGTHLYHSFTCQPVCGPARSVFQSGLYPTTTGCYRNKIPLPDGTKTLAHYFREAGYKTGYIGKWHLADENPVTERGRGGYEYWLAANALEMTSDSYDAVVFDNDNELVKLPGYRVDALTDAAIRFIDAEQEQPFFLFLSFLEPHHQNHRDDYPSPDVYRDSYTGRWTPPDLAALGGTSAQHLGGYYGMVKRLDEALGRLFDAVKSLGLADDTIILFTSDHGCHFKTRNSEYKRSCHESSIRVPTAAIGPGFNSRGQIRELVSLIDLAPTLLDAAGIPVPDVMQGRSILPLLRRETKEWPDDVYIQISEAQVGRAIRTSRWKYSVSSPDPIRDSPSSDVYHEEYLYDLQADPYELTNLIGFESHQEVTAALRERLLRRMAEAGERPARIEPAESKRSGQRRVSEAEVRL